MHNIDSIISYLKTRGARLTPARKAMITLLANSQHPLAADDLRVALESQGITVNKTTIYRELDFLLENEVIRSVQFHDAKKHYEIAQGAHHHHVRCVKCERVEDVHVDHQAESMEKQIAKEHNFKILNHSLEFFGLCPKCQ